MTPQTYIERPPHPALRGVVSSVWIQRAGAEPYVQRDVPSGSVELLCRLGAAPRVVGPLTAARVRTLAPGTTVVGLRLQPGMASLILGVAASELVDLTIDLGDLWGRAGDAAAALADAPTAEVLLARAQDHLVRRLADAAPPDHLILDAVRRLRWHSGDIGELTSALYVSERHLRRRCQEAVGLAPKTLHRILRFQAFLALAQNAIAHGHAPTDGGLSRLAAEAGFADQPHLTRECLRLTGLSPGAFLGAAATTCACGHDHAASFAPILRARDARAA